MNDKEKLLLLDLILQDLRGNWGFDVENRIATAFELAEDLGLSQFTQSINEFEELYECGDGDGRFFRTTYDDGGYIGMADIHGLPYKIAGRSEGFKRESDVLTYPEYIFEDWD